MNSSSSLHSRKLYAQQFACGSENQNPRSQSQSITTRSKRPSKRRTFEEADVAYQSGEPGSHLNISSSQDSAKQKHATWGEGGRAAVHGWSDRVPGAFLVSVHGESKGQIQAENNMVSSLFCRGAPPVSSVTFMVFMYSALLDNHGMRVEASWCTTPRVSKARRIRSHLFQFVRCQSNVNCFFSKDIGANPQ